MRDPLVDLEIKYVSDPGVIEIDEDTEVDFSSEVGWRTAVLVTEGRTLKALLENARIHERDRDGEDHPGEDLGFYDRETEYVATLIMLEHLLEKKSILNDVAVQAAHDQALLRYQEWCRYRRVIKPREWNL